MFRETLSAIAARVLRQKYPRYRHLRGLRIFPGLYRDRVGYPSDRESDLGLAERGHSFRDEASQCRHR